MTLTDSDLKYIDTSSTEELRSELSRLNSVHSNDNEYKSAIAHEIVRRVVHGKSQGSTS